MTNDKSAVRLASFATYVMPLEPLHVTNPTLWREVDLALRKTGCNNTGLMDNGIFHDGIRGWALGLREEDPAWETQVLEYLKSKGVKAELKRKQNPPVGDFIKEIFSPQGEDFYYKAPEEKLRDPYRNDHN